MGSRLAGATGRNPVSKTYVVSSVASSRSWGRDKLGTHSELGPAGRLRMLLVYPGAHRRWETWPQGPRDRASSLTVLSSPPFFEKGDLGIIVPTFLWDTQQTESWLGSICARLESTFQTGVTF